MNYHPKDHIIGDQIEEVRTRSSFKYHVCYTLISEIKPKMIDKALIDDDWIAAMVEELHQFIRNDVWTFVSKSENKSIIGKRWVFRKKNG